MVFASQLFLFLFLPAVLIVYWLMPSTRWKNTVLLAASLLFYATGEGAYVLLMLSSILLNFLLGLAAERYRSSGYIAVVTVVANLGLLGYYKYAGFLVEIYNSLMGGIGVPAALVPEVHLPIGISFFTFQAMSYVFDVRSGQVPAQRQPLDLALYISLFPQLIAGPIVRYVDVWQQISSRTVSVADFCDGISRFVIGLGKKVLIANTVALPADAIFSLAPGDLTPAVAWLGIIAYTLQIYFDFSGYSDMAIGLGRMFGFHFLENFNYPYIARSVQDFWRRWHISLSTWLRDYLYIPLGGSRCGRWRTQINLVIVFLLCGLWHGAAWTFLLWGGYHGIFLVIERGRVTAWLERLPSAVGWAYTTTVFTMGWVLFRADSLATAGNFYAALAGFGGSGVTQPAVNVSTWLDGKLALLILVGIVAASPVVPWLKSRFALQGALFEGLRIAVVSLVLMLSLMELVNGSYNPFIYFRF